MKTQSKYIVESGYEIPKERRASQTYPFSEMDVGDSFSFEKCDAPRVRNAASHDVRRSGKEYRVTVGLLRCWRTA